MQKLLEINNISKTFNTLNGEINAIKSISFDVNNEDFIAIVGSSGCGKSTLLNIISGLLEKTNGTIKFYKENITKLRLIYEWKVINHIPHT